MKKIIYIMVASSFLGAQIFSIDINIMQLSIFRGASIILLFLMLIDYLKNNRKLKLNISNDKDYIIKFYLFWFLYSIFSLLWVKDYYSWLRSIFFIGNGFICIWLISSYVKSTNFFYNIFKIMLFMFILHNIIGWSELLTGDYLFADLSKIDKYSQFGSNLAARVPVSMMGNTNDFATLILCGIFISLIILINSKSRAIKVLSVFNIISSVILIFRTSSRANILALIIGIFILVFIKFIKNINRKSMLVLPTLMLILITMLLIYPPILDNIYDIFTKNIHFSFEGGSDSTRLNLMKNGLYFLKRTVLFGTGAGNIEYWMANENLYNVGNIENMHNWWVEILVGYGILIFIGYIIVYYKIAKNLYKSYMLSNDKFIKSTSLFLLCYMGAFVISSVSSSSNISKEWLWVFWAIVIAYIGYIEKYKQL